MVNAIENNGANSNLTGVAFAASFGGDNTSKQFQLGSGDGVLSSGKGEGVA